MAMSSTNVFVIFLFHHTFFLSVQACLILRDFFLHDFALTQFGIDNT